MAPALFCGRMMAAALARLDVPSAVQFAALRAKLTLLGWQTADIDAAIGAVVNGRTRAQLAAAIVA